MSNNVNNPTKVITGPNTRWSYCNAWEAKAIQGGTPKFSVSLIIPKSDKKTIAKIEEAIKAAYREGEAKLKGNGRSVPALSVLKTPLRDGDVERPDDEAYADSYFVNANSSTAPGIVDADRQPILDHINSLSEDGELMLSLLASFAQEESRSISENVKWGVRRRFQSGEIGTANKHILGYRYDEDEKKYVIIPEEAEAVRWMFQMYIDGVSFRRIAENMNRAGIRTTLGNDFQEASVRQLIFNEVYAGDIRRQKCYMADPITKAKVKNGGELPQYYMADCHEAIIDRETYAKVQAEMERRAGLVNPTYPFTGKIKCGICGNCFTRKKGTVRGKTYVHWICRSKKETGMSCTSVNFSEEELKGISAQALGMDEFDGAVFEKAVRGITVMESGDLEFRLAGGEAKVWKNLHLDPPRHVATVTDCFQGKVKCAACGNTYHRVNSAGKWVYWYCIGKKRKNVECHNPNCTDYKLRQISAHMMGLEEFSEAEFEERIEEITAFPDGSLEFHFKEGRAKRWQRA